MTSLHSMVDTDPNELPVVAPQSSPCRHLRSAGMYISGEGSNKDTAENYDGSSFWCTATMKSFGPDDDMVGGRECRDPSRSCYEPL